jgi:hypothetical protein
MSNPLDEQRHGFKVTNPYSGRWVSRIRDQIIGQGGTPAQALSSAHSSRPKELPLLSFIPFPMTLTYPPILFKLQKIFTSENGIYLVGGVIRDALLGKTSHDLDLVCTHSAKQFAKKAANELSGAFFTMDEERDVHRVILHVTDDLRTVIDFTGCRGSSIEQDLQARDFTINAIAVDLQDPYKTFDPTGGVQDLHDGCLRACNPASCKQDPLRVLRGIRFAAGLILHIEQATREQMKQASNLLGQSSPERKRDELLKILELSQAATALRAFDWLGALDEIIPGLGGYRTAKEKAGWEELLGWIQSIQQMIELLNKENPSKLAQDYNDGLLCMKLGRFDTQLKERFASPIEPDFARIAFLNLSVILAAMSEGHPESQVEKIAVLMKFSREGVRYFNQFASALKAWHALPVRPAEISPLDIFRFYKGRKLGAMDAVLAQIAQASRSDPAIFETETEKGVQLLDGWWNHQDDWVSPRILVNGDELCTEAGMAPGPALGKVLDQIIEYQVSGKIRSREDAIGWAKREQAGK